MIPDPLLEQLRQFQRLIRDLCLEAKTDYRRQYHPDLSPLGWHVGHCIYTENYWIREAWLGLGPPDEKLKSLYLPELSCKAGRGQTLPAHERLCAWTVASQQENIKLLKHDNRPDPSGLMRNNFLVHFLIQHYAQHYETIQMIRTQAALHKASGSAPGSALKSTPLDRSALLFNQGGSRIGAQDDLLPYDNEYPRHEMAIRDFRIARRPVSNSEYLEFIEDRGYAEDAYWTVAGRQWREDHATTQPEYWRRDPAGNWYGVTADGPCVLAPADPVYGICHHEASAFAAWAGARLPDEYEWEAASRAGLLDEAGRVWEWCRNTFQPYAGFRAFPYDGYSLPYFDGRHYTLKGGSRYTRPQIRRPSFRNYYQADKRYLFAGLRLVFEE